MGGIDNGNKKERGHQKNGMSVCCANVMTFLHAILMYAPLRTDFKFDFPYKSYLNFPRFITL